jgi:phosphatidylserine/phosphatidylglycerophosphate/cardiolipin synthase-like enzyme
MKAADVGRSGVTTGETGASVNPARRKTAAGGSGTKAGGRDTIAVRFLEEDGQRAGDVAGWLAEFVGQARESLDIAIYDCRLSEGPAVLLRKMLAARMSAGVRVRLVFDAGDKPQSPSEIERSGVEPAPPSHFERVAELGLPPRAIRMVYGNHALMHHKYVVRDRETVWTGSLNLSDDSMRRMENLVLTLESRPIAEHFGRDFIQLWGTGKVVASGAFATAPAMLRYAGSPAAVDVDFSPGRGRAINAWVADRVAAARRRVVICTMLFTSSRLLGALLGLIERGDIEIEGVYDGTQMAGVLDQWQGQPELAWKVDAVERVIAAGGLVGKASEPYRPDASHNFLHVKAIVVDDTVLTGSHNFSHSAQDNAENILAIESPALAEQVVAYARRLRARYGEVESRET